MGKAIFKFNGGKGALLCSNCSVIVKTGKDFTEQEWAALRGEGHVDSVYCNKCKDSVIDLDKVIENSKEDAKLSALKDIIPILVENPNFKEELIQIVSEKMFKDINDIGDGKQ